MVFSEERLKSRREKRYIDKRKNVSYIAAYVGSREKKERNYTSE